MFIAAASNAARSASVSGCDSPVSGSRATITSSASAARRPSGARSSARAVTLFVPTRSSRTVPTACRSSSRSSAR